jgi:integrase/recombinase XerC
MSRPAPAANHKTGPRTPWTVSPSAASCRRCARGQSRSTAARKLAAVRTFLRYLRREDIIATDPGALVGTPKREVRMPAHLSENDMTRLLDGPDVSAALGRRDRAILELFYASGLRLSELAGLDLDDVNLSRKMARVLGKGGKERLCRSTARRPRFAPI